MRKDSCRSCGEIMKEFQSCPDCKECVQFKCIHCKKIGEIQIHSKCSSKSSAIAN